MTLELHVVSGARAGWRAAYDQAVVTVGRHPTSDFQFDPEGDREVSTRHAELRRLAGRWVVVDLRSTNGTFVNGVRVQGEAELHVGDVLSFGDPGPRVEVGIAARHAGLGHGSATAARASWGGRAGAPSAAVVPSRRASLDAPTPTSERIAAAVQESTRGLRNMLVGVSALLVAVVGGAIAYNQISAREYRAEIARLADEVRRQQGEWDAQYRTMAGRVASLDSAYQTERTRTESLQRDLALAMRRGSADEIEELRRRLRASQSKTRGIVAAAQMDPRKVHQLSGAGVVLVAVQQQDGQSFSGSGFNVAPGGLVVTNRHVVQDVLGRPVKAVRVLFAGAKGAWLPARVVRTGSAKEDDLALLQVETSGTYPTVAGVAPSRRRVEVGSPVATIGFPLGTELPGLQGDINEITASATLTAGTVTRLMPSVVQIDAYSGQGASGSPLLDRDGHVVGVLYGGAPGSGGRIVYAVPSERLIALLPRDAAGIVRP